MCVCVFVVLVIEVIVSLYKQSYKSQIWFLQIVGQ